MNRAQLFLTLCLSLFISHASLAGTDDELEAKAVVARYFDALFVGNTQTLNTLLGGPLKDTRKSLLSNPDYPAHLVRHYEGARFEITNSTRTLDGHVAVDAVILVPNTSPVSVRFLLRRELHDSNSVPGLYIVDEIEPQHPR